MRRGRFIAMVGFAAAFIAACVDDSGTTLVQNGDDASAPSDAGASGDGGGSSTGGDADTDASTANDAGNGGGDGGADAGPACDPMKPFNPPVLLAGSGINSASQASPHLTADEKTLVFYQTVDGGDHIFQATRPDLSSPFAMPIVQSALDHALYNNDPDLSPNGLSIFLSSSDMGTEGEIYSTTRSSLSNAWNPPALVANIHVSGSSDFHAFVTGDGPDAELWLGSTRPNGAGAGDIWKAPSNGAGGFSTPVNVTELNTAQNDYVPVLSPDRLTIFWSSDRTDNGSKGGYDIWTAHRTTTSAPFTSITNVSELNTSGTEYVNWVSPDGCRLYMYRPTKMYVATRPL